MTIRQLIFGQLLEYQYIGIKKRGRIIFSVEEIKLEINRRLEIARNHNLELFNFYWALMTRK